MAAVERLPPVEALKISFYVYPLINALHILAIGATVTSVLVIDLSILGLSGPVAREALLRMMRAIVWIAFPVAVLSGLTLFSIRAREYAVNPAFQIKMALLVLAGLNLLAFRLLTKQAGEYRPAAKALAALSMTFWIGILIAGRFIGFV